MFRRNVLSPSSDLKKWYLLTTSHGLTFLKTNTDIFTVMRTTNITSILCCAFQVCSISSTEDIWIIISVHTRMAVHSLPTKKGTKSLVKQVHFALWQCAFSISVFDMLQRNKYQCWNIHHICLIWQHKTFHALQN